MGTLTHLRYTSPHMIKIAVLTLSCVKVDVAALRDVLEELGERLVVAPGDKISLPRK